MMMVVSFIAIWALIQSLYIFLKLIKMEDDIDMILDVLDAQDEYLIKTAEFIEMLKKAVSK